VRSGRGSAAVLVFTGRVVCGQAGLGCCASVYRSGRVRSGQGLADVLLFIGQVM